MITQEQSQQITKTLCDIARAIAPINKDPKGVLRDFRIALAEEISMLNRSMNDRCDSEDK